MGSNAAPTPLGCGATLSDFPPRVGVASAFHRYVCGGRSGGAGPGRAVKRANGSLPGSHASPSPGSPGPRAWRGARGLSVFLPSCTCGPSPAESRPLHARAPIACLPASGGRETARINKFSEATSWRGSREGTVSVRCRGGQAGLFEKAPGMKHENRADPSHHAHSGPGSRRGGGCTRVVFRIWINQTRSYRLAGRCERASARGPVQRTRGVTWQLARP